MCTISSSTSFGPFPAGRGYQLLKVEGLFMGQLDAHTAAALRRLLFRRWVRELARAARVQLALYEQL